MKFDLLSTVEYGGCSAKLAAQKLRKILEKLPKTNHPDLLVGIDTCDDAGVFKISDEVALIHTTDFFPPVCSDAYEFGQIAAANCLSDVYAMGGKPITALNLMMFPDDKISLDVYSEILQGGNDKIIESGAIVVGGHSIRDFPPKYGMAITGVVHPNKIITNANAKPGDILVLTKPLGTGIIIAGQKLNEVSVENYQNALDYMKLLNKSAAEIMQKYKVRAATDITGFGLLGHSMNMAQASNVSMRIRSSDIPLLTGAYELTDLGCIPGASFRNLAFVEEYCSFTKIDYNLKMLMLDAQTSGGILMCVNHSVVDSLLKELIENVYPQATIIGEVISSKKRYIEVT